MRGAFTGADSNKKGLIEVAEKGTIFLDEIGEMSPVVQVKLLRVLQERKFRRLGGTEEIDADIRILAATNRDLAKMVADGSFREDLFYRINVIPMRLPPLRERPGRHPAARRALRRAGSPSRWGSRSPASRAPRCALTQYRWPGNIRELENAMERAVALERTPTILPDSLPEQLQSGRRPTRPHRRRTAGRRSRTPGSTSNARPGHRAGVHRRSAPARRRRQGQGCRTARNELPVLPVLHEEVQPEIGASLPRCAIRGAGSGVRDPLSCVQLGFCPFGSRIADLADPG